VRSDIYSLGETLWFALTGKTPFAGHSVEEIHRAQQSNALPIEQLKTAHVPSRLRSLLESMLALEPASRPGTHELAARLQRCSPETRRAGRTRLALVAAAFLVISLSAFLIFLSLRTQNSLSNLGAPDKSIAVLPIENLSDDPNNAYFADGIQEEILTRLASIADLKVISRTSTQRYHSKPGNLAEIAKQLGVANIVEGSVQKAVDQVRVSVRLINAQTDSDLWADSYDRKLTDIFGVESEIAKGIVESLQAKLTGREEQALSVEPTNNPTAYDAYLRGLSLEHNEYSNGAYLQAATDYAEAVRLDLKFALAWARLAVTRGYLYSNRVEANTNTPEAVKEAADRAMALAPDAGESWIAQGAYFYRVQRDFAAALAAFQKAQKRLPNNVLVYAYMAHIQRRLGRWQDAEANYKKAIDLDPRNVALLSVIGSEFYNYLRRFDDALAMLNRTLEIAPDSNSLRANKVIVLQEAGRLSEAAQELARIPATSTEDEVVWVQIGQGFYERQYDAAIQVAERRVNATVTGQPLDPIAISALVNAGYCYAWTERPDEARRAFKRAITELKPTADSVVSADGNGSPMLLAQAYAGLGEKENALKQAQQALKDYETDAIGKPQAEIVLAEIQAQLGDRDTAIAALPHLLEVPAGLTRADLKFNPFWDPLRSDPRYQKLCEEKQP
jgi:TolB-like protein/Tfp pilus assembly protein PilF